MKVGQHVRIVRGPYKDRDAVIYSVAEPEFLYDTVELDLGEEIATKDTVAGEQQTSIIRVNKDEFVSRGGNLDLI